MRTKALLLFVALPLAGCSQQQAPESLPPAGLAGGAGGGTVGGGAAAPHVPFGAQGQQQPAVAHGMAQQAPGAGQEGHTAPHPPMNTVPSEGSPHGGAAPAPATPTIIPGGGSANVENAADLSGVVAEAHHVREYTYMRLTDANGNDSWAAVLKDEGIRVGTRVAVGKDIWMTDFQSPSMGRTFDRILFGRLLSKQ